MGVSKAIDISPQARKTVKELLQRYLPGVTVWAYGSRVKWTARPDSDLDLVVFAGKEQRGDVANLREAFEESNLPFRVDVFIWDEVPEKFREEIREATVKHTSPAKIKAFRSSFPPLPMQRKIAHVLATLDDKIELNRQMNQTLEAIAQAIFKSWFVDFDPVKAKQVAKALGRDSERAAMAALSGKLCVPKNAADLSVEDVAKAEAELDQLGEEERKQLEQTARLFPGGFVESELGLIPEGWEVAPLETYIEITKGRSYKSTELAESTTALVTLKSFQPGGGYREDGLKAFTGQYKPEQKVKPGELIVAFTDVTQAADVVGKPALVRSDPDYDTLVASLDVGIVRPTSHLNLPYLYFTLMTPRFQSHAYGHCSGTTVLHLSKTALPSYQAIIPKSQLTKQFDFISQPTLNIMEELAQESRTLAALRDSLLPKLLSGEISLCEAEAQTEKALPIRPLLP